MLTEDQNSKELIFHLNFFAAMQMKRKGGDIITHPLYSPDLAPSDYHLFPKLKEHLAGRRFISDEEVKDEVQRFLKDLAASWYDMAYKNCHSVYKKCIDRNGDYVEK